MTVFTRFTVDALKFHFLTKKLIDIQEETLNKDIGYKIISLIFEGGLIFRVNVNLVPNIIIELPIKEG